MSVENELPAFSSDSTMSPDEIAFLESKISEAKYFLEFGAGFSTKLALKNSNTQIVSIETSAEYIEAFKQELAVGQKSVPNVELVHIDIGKTRDWGRPVDESEIEKWPAYSEKPWNYIKEKNFKPDLILIDGRFRVATLIQAWRFAPGCTVLFDDYKKRTHYHKVEELIKPTKIVGRIGVFKIPKFLRRKGGRTALRLLPIYRYEFE